MEIDAITKGKWGKAKGKGKEYQGKGGKEKGKDKCQTGKKGVNAVTEQPPEPDPNPGMVGAITLQELLPSSGWIGAVTSSTSCKVLVDSGAVVHVCGPNHYNEFETQPLNYRMPTRLSSQGRPIACYGRKRVQLQVGGKSLAVPLCVMCYDPYYQCLCLFSKEHGSLFGYLHKTKQRVKRHELEKGRLIAPPEALEDEHAASAVVEEVYPASAVEPREEDHTENAAGAVVDDVCPTSAAETKVKAARVREPTKEERHMHNLTHLPYQPWCSQCVMARGRESPHFAKGDTEIEEAENIQMHLPVVQADYWFVKS
eukprot:1180149-Amphidinium_carterae.1